MEVPGVLVAVELSIVTGLRVEVLGWVFFPKE